VLSVRSGLLVTAVVTFLEELGEGAAGFAAPQSGTIMHPSAKSNATKQAPGRIQEREGEEADERVRSCID
jgi:hypothetical protein